MLLAYANDLGECRALNASGYLMSVSSVPHCSMAASELHSVDSSKAANAPE